MTSEERMRRVDEIQRYLLLDRVDDTPEEVARKFHVYCVELINHYLESESRRAELFADAMAARIDLRAQRGLVDEYGEFCAACDGDGRHLQFVQWLDLREGK